MWSEKRPENHGENQDDNDSVVALHGGPIGCIFMGPFEQNCHGDITCLGILSGGESKVTHQSAFLSLVNQVETLRETEVSS